MADKASGYFVALFLQVHMRDEGFFVPGIRKQVPLPSSGEVPRHSQGGLSIAFFNSAIGVLQTLVIALGAGLGIWGAINLLEGYGNDNPGAKSQGMKHLMPE